MRVLGHNGEINTLQGNVNWGFPVWLKFVPGITFRADNGPFKCKSSISDCPITHLNLLLNPFHFCCFCGENQ
ncbi:hypothetical protein P3L10_021028 [Capsicum annuum]